MKLYVKDAREKSDLTQLGLSKSTCIARSYLQNLEIPNTKANPSACVLCRLARALDVPVGNLFACDP